MIDVKSRLIAADLINKFLEGEITNDYFVDEYPCHNNDAAIKEIFDEMWYLYDDLRTHKLTGADRLSEKDAEMVRRCVLFLRSNKEYTWPVIGGWLRILWFFLDIGTFSISFWIRKLYFAKSGDLTVWPFRQREEYINELTRVNENQGVAEGDAGKTGPMGQK